MTNKANANLDKDQVSKEEVTQNEEVQVSGDETAVEKAEEAEDLHIASTELPVGELLPEEQQADTDAAEGAKGLVIPGAASGPDRAGIVRNEEGKVAYAPPGSRDAANNGVQEDAAGHVDSVGTDNSPKSGVRV